MGFYLTAVGSTDYLCHSLMPTKRHFLFDLNLFSLLMFSLAEFANIFCIGIVALMLQRPTLVDLGGISSPFTYGLLAPLVSGSICPMVGLKPPPALEGVPWGCQRSGGHCRGDCHLHDDFMPGTAESKPIKSICCSFLILPMFISLT